MKSFVSMVKANLKMQVRNRTALFWLLAFPAIFILIFGFLFGKNSDFTATVGVINGHSTPIAKEMTKAMNKSSFFHVNYAASKKEELQKLRQGNIDAVLVFPKNVSPGQTLQVKSYVDKSKLSTSQAVSAAINQVAQQFNQGANKGPKLVAVSTQSVQSHHLRYVDYLVPGFVGMSIMQNGILGLSAAFVTLRERGVLRRIRVTPFPLLSFIAARIVSNLIVVLCQVAILLGMAKAVFNLQVGGNVADVALNVAIFAILGALAFLTLGFFVAGISRKVENANTLGNLITFPMLFLAGVFYPLDQSPTWLQDIAKVLPLSYLADGLRQSMVYGTSVTHLWVDALALIITAIVGMFLAVRFFRWEPRAN